jgi:hypothetical protein
MQHDGTSTPEIYRRRNANVARNKGKLRELGLLDKPPAVEEKWKGKRKKEERSSE